MVPNLTKSCVLGIDILRPMGGVINLEDDTLTVLNEEGKKYTVNIKEENTPSSTMSELCYLGEVDASDELTVDLLNQKMEDMAKAPDDLL